MELLLLNPLCPVMEGGEGGDTGKDSSGLLEDFPQGEAVEGLIEEEGKDEVIGIGSGPSFSSCFFLLFKDGLCDMEDGIQGEFGSSHGEGRDNSFWE